VEPREDATSAPLTRRAALAGALAALGAAACGTAPPTGPQPYALLPTARRAPAVDLAGTNGRGAASTVASARGRVLLVAFDVPGYPATRQQLAVLRRAYYGLRGRGVRLLRVDVSGSLLVPERAAVQGRIVTFPARPAVDLGRRALRLAGDGFAQTQIVDRRGRVAASLLGASDPSRLELTLERLLAEDG
jgi:hypothetical protein